MALKTDLLKSFDFNWEVIDVIVGGHSCIDSQLPLQLHGADDISNFIRNYGYDIENPIESAELFGNFQEALNFIRKFFINLTDYGLPHLEIPRKILETTDIAHLLALACEHSSTNSLWACSVLKVMHSISHLDKDVRTSYFPDIQKQILDRFYKFVFTDESGQLYLGKDIRDAERVPLVSFESKPKKSRDSLILKMLHKSENVAEDIFDRVGIRFVTRNSFDAMRVVKFLRDRQVVIAANIKPSRSRNNLVDANKLKSFVIRKSEEVSSGELSIEDLYQQCVELCEIGPIDEGETENPHTSKHYKSIQFTSRQLIKIVNPIHDDLKRLKASLKQEKVSDEILKLVDGVDLKNIQKEIRFFYPYETQIFDERSYRENQAGRSSHSNYKKSQVLTAAKRVLGDLIKKANATD